MIRMACAALLMALWPTTWAMAVMDAQAPAMYAAWRVWGLAMVLGALVTASVLVARWAP